LISFCALAFVATVAEAQFSGPGVSPSTLPTPRAAATTDPALLYPAARDLRVGPGDLLVIRLFGAPDYDPTVRVSVDGSIQLPLIGVVSVTGLTVNELESLIAQRLSNAGMYRNPQVTVQVTESQSQFVTVTGEVHAIVPIQGERRLFDILSASSGGGGTTAVLPPNASHLITILRPGVEKPIIVDLGSNAEESAKADIPIFARDTIVISRVGVVYVVGAFKIQGAIPLVQNAPLTLLQASSLSGGIGFEGRMEDLRIIRTIGEERKEIRVNIGKVLNGKAPDPVLQAEDIVFLPSNPIKAAIKSGGVSTIAGIANILVYAIDR
jgi:polysaccharide export outer membrane protein